MGLNVPYIKARLAGVVSMLEDAKSVEETESALAHFRTVKREIENLTRAAGFEAL